MELLALVCATQSADRNLVRLPRRIPSLSLKADTKMKTTNLHLREFAKNSRIFAAFAAGANRAPQFFFPRKSAFGNLAGIRYANAAKERNLSP